MREDAVLHAGEEDHGKLQTLGRMQGHEGDDALLVVGNLVGICHERHALEEARETRILRVSLVFGAYRLKLSKILHTCLILGIVRGLELGEVPGLLKNGLEKGGGTRPGLLQRAQV